MSTDTDDQTDDVAVQAQPDTGMHPIKKLEAFFKGHLKQTTALAGHVETVAGVASEASKLAQSAVESAASLLTQFQTYAEKVEARFNALEGKIEAMRAPALSGDIETATKELDAAVTDVQTATTAAASTAEQAVAAPIPEVEAPIEPPAA